MTPTLALLASVLACAALFAAGAWAFDAPRRARRRVSDARAGHYASASLYEAHYGSDPEWLDDFVAPPLGLAGRRPLPFRLAGLALMAAAGALLYNRLFRLGVI